MRSMIRGAAFGLIAALSLSACGGSDSSDDNPLTGSSGDSDGKALVVGSANFPENQLLAEIYAQALEAKDLKVTRKFDIGAREVYYDQIVKGGISVFPEYNGALLAVAVDEKSTATSSEDINAELKAKLPSSVEILDSAAAEDKDSVTVTAETAAKYNLKTLADLKPVAGDMSIGAGSEFKTRTQGLVGLKTIYGVEFGKFQPLDAGAQSTLLELLKKDTVQPRTSTPPTPPSSRTSWWSSRTRRTSSPRRTSRPWSTSPRSTTRPRRRSTASRPSSPPRTCWT